MKKKVNVQVTAKRQKYIQYLLFKINRAFTFVDTLNLRLIMEIIKFMCFLEIRVNFTMLCPYSKTKRAYCKVQKPVEYQLYLCGIDQIL